MDPRNQGQTPRTNQDARANPNGVHAIMEDQAQQSGPDLDHLNLQHGTTQEHEDLGIREDQPKQAEPSKDERWASLLAQYEFAMAHNSPHTPAFLAELYDLSGVKRRATVAFSTKEIAKLADMGGSPQMLPFDAARMKLDVGSVVPADVKTQSLPQFLTERQDQYEGHSYLMVGHEALILDPSRKIVAIADLHAPDKEQDERDASAVKEREDKRREQIERDAKRDEDKRVAA